MPPELTTFSQRAKEWHTTPFFAEWLDNTYRECTSPPGKQKFEEWVVERYGSKKGMAMIQECNMRTTAHTRGKLFEVPKRRSDKVLHMWKHCAMFYGVSTQAMSLWHEYALVNDLFLPERTKEPPRRRRGESSVQWISFLDGHKFPNIDLDVARRIAISEYDKTRDLWELWRRNSDCFFSDIVARSKSIIPSPHVLSLDERTRQKVAIDDALRTRILFLCLLHLAWKDAAELFGDLASMGLKTPSAVEIAYRKDNSLLWRFVSVITRVAYLQRKMWANLTQMVAASEYYKTFLKSWRDADQCSHIESNGEINRNTHQKSYSTMDDMVVNCIVAETPLSGAFLQGVEVGLSEDPTEATKFSADVFDAMGDLATTLEFVTQLERSSFGFRLREYACELQASQSAAERAQMRSILCHMDPAQLPTYKAGPSDQYGEATRLVRELQDTWGKAVWQLTIYPGLETIQDTHGPAALEKIRIPTVTFNEMWLKIDEILWDAAAGLDPPGERGRTARSYGLFNPKDPKRPVASLFLLWELDPKWLQNVSVKPRTTPTAYVQNIPIASAGDSIVQSGRTFVAGLGGGKEKLKTRGLTMENKPEPEEREPGPEDGEDEIVLPELLPTEFKLGKKILKLFHRILEPPEEEKENAPAKGQVRWGDFEHAMKRVGFVVVRTAGSSVRFDPPASTARPITFHRPHPDSLLSTHQIKWVGARLKRTYGWTTGTFQRAEATEGG